MSVFGVGKELSDVNTSKTYISTSAVCLMQFLRNLISISLWNFL